jgi:hypothetical protein
MKPNLKIPKDSNGRVVKPLPSKRKALSSNPSTAKKREKKEDPIAKNKQTNPTWSLSPLLFGHNTHYLYWL